jgi:hypothetical protein
LGIAIAKEAQALEALQAVQNPASGRLRVAVLDPSTGLALDALSTLERVRAVRYSAGVHGKAGKYSLTVEWIT